MSPMVTIEVPAKSEALVRRCLALAEELEQLALTAPDGTVFEACETAIVDRGRDLQAQMLTEAVARRVEAAEKKGRRCAFVPAASAKKTAAPRPANSSVRSG